MNSSATKAPMPPSARSGKRATTPNSGRKGKRSSWWESTSTRKSVMSPNGKSFKRILASSFQPRPPTIHCIRRTLCQGIDFFFGHVLAVSSVSFQRFALECIPGRFASALCRGTAEITTKPFVNIRNRGYGSESERLGCKSQTHRTISSNTPTFSVYTGTSDTRPASSSSIRPKSPPVSRYKALFGPRLRR